MNKFNTIDEYIASFPKDIQKILEQLRVTIRKAAPDAEETIRYGIPTLILKGNLVHFGAYKNHIGFYPSPSGILTFQKELAMYKSSKGAIQFPINKPLPLDLIVKIITFRIKENIEKMTSKRTKQMCSHGHLYDKKNNSLDCPKCEKEKKQQDPFSLLATPAQRALKYKNTGTAHHLL